MPQWPMRSVFDRVRDLFTKKGKGKAAPSTRIQVATGTTGRGGLPIDPEVVEEFIYNQHILYVTSSTVASAQYFLEEQRLLLEFLPKGGGRRTSAYLYSGVNISVALSFAQAASKGEWVWETIRWRGLNRFSPVRLR